MKSPTIASCTSGNWNISAVPVVCVSPFGAIISGFAAGSEVRSGFCDSAASSAAADSDGVMRWTSVLCASAGRLCQGGCNGRAYL